MIYSLLQLVLGISSLNETTKKALLKIVLFVLDINFYLFVIQ